MCVVLLRLVILMQPTMLGFEVLSYYGSIIAGGLAVSKNLSLESADIQAFVMERLPIVWDF